jgi:hypothetical protein
MQAVEICGRMPVYYANVAFMSHGEENSILTSFRIAKCAATVDFDLYSGAASPLD